MSKKTEEPEDVTKVNYNDLREDSKVAPIKARKMSKPFRVNTLEGLETGQPGDYLAIGVKGERWIIRDDIFKLTYVPRLPCETCSEILKEGGQWHYAGKKPIVYMRRNWTENGKKRRVGPSWPPM